MTPKLIEHFADNGEHSHWELIDTADGSSLWVQPEDVRKKYTTHDSVTMYEGETPVWVTNELNGLWGLWQSQPALDKWHIETGLFIVEPNTFKIFSTPEASQLFIERENKGKVAFTCENGAMVVGEYHEIYGVNSNFEPLQTLAKHGGTFPDYKWFSTKEVRDTYISRHKPKYSLTDIEKVIEDLTSDGLYLSDVINELKKLKE